MPRADKAAFIQNMLSELELKQNGSAPTKPEPDSKEWWREVAQELGVGCAALQRENAQLREALDALRAELATAMGQNERFRRENAKLREAGQALYDVGRWSCDRPVGEIGERFAAQARQVAEAALWEALRDALAPTKEEA